MVEARAAGLLAAHKTVMTLVINGAVQPVFSLCYFTALTQGDVAIGQGHAAFKTEALLELADVADFSPGQIALADTLLDTALLVAVVLAVHALGKAHICCKQQAHQAGKKEYLFHIASVLVIVINTP